MKKSKKMKKIKRKIKKKDKDTRNNDDTETMERRGRQNTKERNQIEDRNYAFDSQIEFSRGRNWDSEEREEREERKERRERDRRDRSGFYSHSNDELFLEKLMEEKRRRPAPPKIIERDKYSPIAKCELIKSDRKPLEFLYLPEDMHDKLVNYLKTFKEPNQSHKNGTALSRRIYFE